MLDELRVLRQKANIEGRNAELKQFRADFKAVWRYWRDSGEISEDELVAGYPEASAAVRAHQGDREWMACAIAHFRRLAEGIEVDAARADRIRNEARQHSRGTFVARSPD